MEARRRAAETTQQQIAATTTENLDDVAFSWALSTVQATIVLSQRNTL
jgi:hypothetical protein